MRRVALVLTALLATAVGCHHHHHHHADHMAMMADEKTAVAVIKPSSAATTMPVNNAVAGTVVFHTDGDHVKVTASIDGLAPGSVHGIHIHEKGDLGAADLSSAGGHFNPTHHAHGGPSTSPVHAGDLGNLTADATGHATLDLTTDAISIGTGMANDIVGKSVIIHAKSDDFSSQPSGNSGARVAGGVIELKQ